MKDMNEFKTLLNIEPEQRVGEQMGNYRLTRWLGRGAFADVYLGEHLYLKRQSAIKLLHMHLPEKARKNFLNEACTIARLDHPHIMRVLDYGVENRAPFLVMAYASNGSLRQRFPEGTQVPLEQIVPLVQQIASALDYAHQQRVIHRDVKPENILIEAQDQVLLSDFGIALVVQSMHSQAAKAIAGTLLYMAPEMLEGKVHFASDQYALGIMIYEWLCGQCPFTGTSIQISTQHVVTPPPSLCKRVPGLPPAIEQVVFKALAKDRAQRYENVIAFANALQDACKDATSITANISTSQPSFPLSERPLEPNEMPTIAQRLLPIGPDANLLSEKQSSSESVSGVDPLSTAPLNADRGGRDIPLTRRTQRNRSKLLGLIFLCLVITASGIYAALLPLRASKPDMSVHLTPVVTPPIVPAIKSISGTQPSMLASPTTTMYVSSQVISTPPLKATPQVISTPPLKATPQVISTPLPVVIYIRAIDDSVQGTSTDQFNYVGNGWGHCTGGCGGNPPDAYAGSNSWDNSTNDYVTIAFDGTQIKFYGVVGPPHGLGAISIDGGSETMLDFYSSTKAGNTLLYVSPLLAAGQHTLKVRVTGKKSSQATWNGINPDRVDIIS